MLQWARTSGSLDRCAGACALMAVEVLIDHPDRPWHVCIVACRTGCGGKAGCSGRGHRGVAACANCLGPALSELVRTVALSLTAHCCPTVTNPTQHVRPGSTYPLLPPSHFSPQHSSRGTHAPPTPLPPFFSHTGLGGGGLGGGGLFGGVSCPCSHEMPPMPPPPETWTSFL
ncbi:hypothetical protein T492DRAFT_376308 [Pavlovales sp. CCMP2436]|nr:hypothetical protein T492DRAFT_376308 [Pavlovales sp. CCMP2436]